MERPKCPGQDTRFKKISDVVYYIPCTHCGEEVEFWHDDNKRKCLDCGETVQPDLETLMRYHNCASTCRMANDCLGDDKYMRLILQEERTYEQGKEDLEDLLRIVPKEEEKISNYLKEIIPKNLKSGYLLDMDTDIEPLKEGDTNLYHKLMDYLKIYMKSLNDPKL